MKALPTSCIVGAVAFMGFYLASGNRPVATLPDAVPEAAANVVAPALYAEASAKLAAALQAAPGSVTSVDSGPSMTRAEIADDSIGPKLASLGDQDVAQPLPAARDAADDAPKKELATQDFRYLIYYVWSGLPPAQKPAEIVLRSLKDIPVGTPAEEIKRASDAFGLDFNFMKAVAKIESGFNPNQRTGSYIGLFQLSEYEFGKFGFGQIRSPRDNAVAAAYKVITEGILFEWITHRKPDLSDLYLIHQQGWEGAAEHISQPDRIAWKSMCATRRQREGREVVQTRDLGQHSSSPQAGVEISGQSDIEGVRRHVARAVAEFYTKYMATAAGEANQ